MYARYSGLCLRLFDKDHNLISYAKNVFGKVLMSEDEKKFFNLLSLHDGKIKEDVFISCYYEAFKDVLKSFRYIFK